VPRTGARCRDEEGRWKKQAEAERGEDVVPLEERQVVQLNETFVDIWAAMLA
jgi:hypothetical protein